MTPEKINLIKKNLEKVASKKTDRKYFKKAGKILLYFFIFFLLICTSLSYNVIFSDGGVITHLSRLPLVSQFNDFMTGFDRLSGERQDRVNILLLGQGGPGHEGPYLTDTMIFLSLKPSTGQVAMVSIPRDLLVPIENYGYRKINNANAIGESLNYEGGGSAFTANVVSKFIEQPVHYWVRIDFSGFTKIVDEVGGLDVYVDRSFSDPLYPDEQTITKTITFEQGLQHFDGERALIFARSRHGNNGEGSDFARDKRQQKIIMALKNKILQPEIFLNPKKIYNLYNLISDNLQSNITFDDLPRFLKLSRKLDLENPIQKVIDSAPDGLLIESTTEEGAFVLMPRVSDYSELITFAENIFIEEKK